MTYDFYDSPFFLLNMPTITILASIFTSLAFKFTTLRVKITTLASRITTFQSIPCVFKFVFSSGYHYKKDVACTICGTSYVFSNYELT